MIQRNILGSVTVGFFAILALWWIVLYFLDDFALAQQNLYWAATYQLMAWWAAAIGIVAAKPWGWFQSYMGRGITFFAIGLGLQGFGQTTFSIYTTVLGIEIPYPSIADIGYFGSVIAYLIGIWYIARVAGVTFRLKSFHHKMQVVIFPTLLLVVSYTFFLREYELDWSGPLRIILDFGYPLGEALYLGVAILALSLSRNILGGIMRGPLTLLMAALVAQYVAEFNFLYQAANESWQNGGYGDMLYLLSYFVIALALVRIKAALDAHHQPGV